MKNQFHNYHSIAAEDTPWFFSIASIALLPPSKTIAAADALGSYRAMWNAEESVLRTFFAPGAIRLLSQYRKRHNPEADYEQFLKSNMHMVPYNAAEYPLRLTRIPDPPLALFVIGSLPDPNRPAISVIGARGCSDYGRIIARKLGHFLGEHHIPLISGMARGVDGISQFSAVEKGGYSAAILGSGPDVCYPRENKALYDRLCEQGGIISTYGPGTPPAASYFPPRNRIVSALSDAVVVVEAKQKSGTLITVDMALEQGKEVYAAPGRITDHLSEGCNGLIGQGARPYLSPEILLEEIYELYDYEHNILQTQPHIIEPTSSYRKSFEADKVPEPDLGQEALQVYRVLDYEPQQMDEIYEKLLDIDESFTFQTMQMLLVQLQLAGWVNQRSCGSYARAR